MSLHGVASNGSRRREAVPTTRNRRVCPLARHTLRRVGVGAERFGARGAGERRHLLAGRVAAALRRELVLWIYDSYSSLFKEAILV